MATLQHLERLLQERAAAGGWRGGLTEYKDYYWVKLWGDEDGIRKHIHLHLVGEAVQVRTGVPILAAVDTGLQTREVELGAADFEQRLLSLFDQAESELAQIGWEEVAKARQRSQYVKQHWWPPQRWRDRRAREAQREQFELVLQAFAAGQGGRVKKTGECDRHVIWPRKQPRALIEFSDFYMERSAEGGWQSGYDLSISPARRERTGLFSWEWREIWGRRALLGGWDDVEGLRAGLARLRVLHEALDRVEAWAEVRDLRPRWAWKDPDFHRVRVLTLEPRARRSRGGKTPVLTWPAGKVEVEVRAQGESEGREFGSVADEAPDFLDRVLALLEDAWREVTSSPASE